MPRAEKKFHFIYKTTNLLSGKYYIGMHSTDNIEDGYLGSGKRLRYSVNKYGRENHTREILEFFDSRETLKAREKEIVCLDELAKEECMNLVVGGEGNGGFFSMEASKKGGFIGGPITRKKYEDDKDFYNKMANISSLRMKQLHKTGKITNNKSFLGKHHSQETKEKIGKANSNQRGIHNSQYGTIWITNGLDNKKILKTEIIPDNWYKGRVKKQ